MKLNWPRPKTIARFGGLALVVFSLLQLIPVDRTTGHVAGGGDLLRLHPAPPAVAATLRAACYDCHSNETRYPWYARVQPAAWWLQSHIREGRAEVNFSAFGDYSPARQITKLEMIADAVEEGSMPLDSYTWVHWNARLTKKQRAAISEWCESSADQVRGN
jgi:hypothetical protein